MGRLTKTKRAEAAWDRTYRTVIALDPFNLEKASELINRTAQVHGKCPNEDILFESIFSILKEMYLKNTYVGFRNELLKKVGKLMGSDYRTRLANLSTTRTWA